MPYFNAPIYLENKSDVGKIDEILGSISEVFFSVKPADGISASSFKEGDKLYINPEKLLPLQRFLPGAAGSGGCGSWLSANARVAPDLIEQSGEGPPPTPNLLLDDVVRSFEDGIGMLPTIAASRSNLSQPGMLPVIFTARDGTPTPTPGREGLTGSRTASNEPSKGAAAAPAAAPPEVEVPEP